MDNIWAKRALRLLPVVFYIILIIFLAIYLTKIDYSKFANISISWIYVVIASVFGVAVRYWGAYVWIVLLEKLSHKKLTDTTELVYIYAKSWLARYIPGTAAWIVSKVYFASKLGISRNKLAVSSLLEGGLQVTIVMASALVLLLLDSRFNLIGGSQRLLMFTALLACIIVLVPAVFNKIVSIVYKIIKRKTFAKEHYVTSRLVARGTLLYLVWSLIGGMSLFFIAKAAYPELGYNNLLFVMGVSNLAGALSMLAFFAPSGLGVREGIQLALLSLIMPTEIALLVAVITRIWSVGVDVLFFVITAAIRRI